MVDALALMISHGLLVAVIFRLVKVKDPEMPSREVRKVPERPRLRA